MGVTKAFKEAIWLNDVVEDGQSAIHLAKNQIHHSRTKHIDVQFQFVGEILQEGDTLLHKIVTANNPSDMLTKTGLGVKFNHYLHLIYVGRI